MATAAVISGVTITSGTAVSVALSTLASGTSGSNTVAKQGVEVSTSTSFTGTASVYGTTSPIALSTGLIAGSTYYFRVSGYTSGNVIVSGTSSNVIGPITMVATPAAPTVAVGNGVNTLTLATSLTGAASYTIQRDTANTFNTANLLSVSGVTLAASYVDNGSVMPFGAKGTTYFYRYRGVAADGTSLGANSASSAAAVYATVPDAPTNLVQGTTARSTTTIPLTWTAVTNTAPTNGGVTLNASAYTVQRSPAGTNTWTSPYTATATVTNYSAASLTPNTQYDFRVTASNARGASAPTDSVSAWTRPNASVQPTTLTLQPGSATTVLVSTATNTVSGQKYYIIPYLNGTTAQDGTNGTTDLRVTFTGTGTPISNFEVSNLTAGATYRFATQAYNTFETVAVSSLSSGSIVPGIVPGLPQGTLSVSAQAATSITITGFSKPTDFGSYTDISGYVVDRSPNGTSWTNASSVVATTATSYAFTGLAANTGYWLRIAARNASGTGPYRYLVVNGDDTVAPTTAPTGTFPATPATPTATFTSFNVDDSMNISVTFTSVNGATYDVFPYIDGDVSGNKQTVTASATSTTVVFNSLTGYTSYRFRAVFKGIYGDATSAYSNVIVPYTEPPTTIKAPSGKEYRLYAPNYKTIYWFSYADLNIADASFGLTTLADGSAAWSVTDTVTGLTDKFRGQRSIIFGSAPNAGGNTGPRVVFHGGGSNNTDLEYAYASTWEPASGTIQVTMTGIAAADGSMLLFAAGETFTRNTTATWQLDRALTFKTIGQDATKGKATILIPNWASATWNINCITSNITMEDIIIDGNNNTTRNNVLFKCAAPTTPFSLIENFTFKNVEFRRFGSKGLDFHYVKNVTFDNCVIDEVTNGATVVLSSCKDVVVKNSTIACSSWGTFSILTSDGPNYLWNNSTSALWPAVDESQADYEARRLDALNNKNIDLTLNNSFPAPTGTYTKNPNKVAFIDINLFRFATVGARIGKPANVTDLANDNSHYQVSLSSTELKLPTGKFGIEYAAPNTAYPTFNYPYKNLADSTSYSNASLRTSQFGPGAVTVTSDGSRIYPAGYETAPDTPVVTATRHADGGRVDLSWAAVAANDDDGMDATDPYTVAVSPSAGSVSVSGTSASVTGLTNGTPYSFTVTANNAAGLTAASESVSATPAKIPDTPSGLSLTAQDTTISVSIGGLSTDTEIGGSAINTYRVKVYDASENGTLIKTVDSSSNPVVVDLSDGTAYYFSAQAKNDILSDFSAESARSGPLATVTSPGSPSVNTPTAGYKSISLSWSAPTAEATGGNTAFTYKVKRVNGATEVEETVTPAPSGLPGGPVQNTSIQHTLSGLTGGVEYTVFVAAVGNVDTTPGAYSLGQQVTPYSEPGIPAAPTLTSRTSTSITLEWSAPAINGKPIDAYKVRKSENGGVTYTTLSEAITGTSYTAIGLSPNTSYKFTVAAYNLGGWSENSEPLTASTTASAPTITTLTGVGRALVATVTPPSGATVNSYGVKVNGSEITPVTVSGTDISFNVASDVIGSISVVVYAITDAGNGADSSSKAVTVPIADPNDQASAVEILQEIISSGANEAPVVVNNQPEPIIAPILDTANQAASNAIPPNQVVVIKSSETQPLKDDKPVAAVKFDSLTDDNAVKDAMVAASSTGTNRIAITEERQVGTAPQTVTTVLTVNPTASGGSSPDITVSNNTVPPANPTYTATATIKQSESTGVPAGGKIAVAIEPMSYEENDLTKPAPVPKEGVAIIFKMLDAAGNVISSGFNLKMRVHVPSKAGAGTLDRWHYHDDDSKYHLEDPAIETPAGSGYFEFIQDHNDTIALVPQGSDPNAAPPLCFLGNARVLTPAGYRRIDSLAVGDKVKTADGRTVAIQRVIAKEYAPMRSTNPYVIPTGQFGATEEVLISPKHCVAVAGRGMVEASKLGLEQRKMSAPFTYYNLELPCHDTDNLVVGGVEVESLANVLRIEVTKEQFIAMMRARYGALTPDLLARAARACFITATGKVNMPVFKRAASK